MTAPNPESICILEEWTVPSSERQCLVQLLHRLRGLALMTQGYQLGTVWVDINDPTKVLTLDSWQSLHRWREFRRHPRFQAMLEDIHSLAANSTLRFVTVARDEELSRRVERVALGPPRSARENAYGSCSAEVRGLRKG